VHESGRATVVLGVRGVVTFQVRLTGAVAPLHSGNWGGVAPNPAWRLVHLLASKAAFEAMPADVDAVLRDIGADAMEPPAGLGFHQRLSRPTFTINSLTCEDAGEHRTIIPNVAVAKCDMRLVAGQRADAVKAAIRRHIASREPAAEVTFGGSLPIAEFGDALGIPCYGIPLANADERNHAPNENMEVDRFLRGISGAAGVLLALGGAL
jgi:acetylornithine deacetylase/succinyl-diaminopimelate desuccinylase-like protein